MFPSPWALANPGGLQGNVGIFDVFLISRTGTEQQQKVPIKIELHLPFFFLFHAGGRSLKIRFYVELSENAYMDLPEAACRFDRICMCFITTVKSY